MGNLVFVIFGVVSFILNMNSGLCEILPDDIRLENVERANITSPNYPNNYGNNVDLLWRVIAPAGYRVALRFTDMNTEQKHDYVTVYEGRTPHVEEAVQRINVSGHTPPGNITSIGSYLLIRFTSDVEGTNKGFRAVASCVDIREIVLGVAETANITSPKFPNTFDRNADILWKVTSPAGYRVLLHFSEFNTGRHHDNITVYEGRMSDFDHSVMRIQLSGSTLQNNITSVGSYLWFRFTSDGYFPSSDDRSFNAQLVSVATRVINLTVMETANLTSSNYPNTYDNNTDILWKVIAPPGYRTTVVFSSFNTEAGYDNVTIFEGRAPDFEESTEITKLSGNPRLGKYTSIGSFLWLRFTSDGLNTDTYTGFSALLSYVTKTDIELRIGETVEVTSPNFPNEYDNHADILWKVTAPAGNRVVVHFTDLDTELGFDFVTIYDGRVPNFEMSAKRIHVSGHASTHNTTSIGSYLWIRFTSDHRTNIDYTGFRAELYSVPVRDILLTTEMTSYVTSPHYPHLYDSNTDIVWKVRAPTGYRVVVSFSAFNTMSDFDFVTIFEGLTSAFEGAEERTKLSGNTLPDNITSIGSYVWLRFTSGDELQSCVSCSGFKALLSTVQGHESQSPTASLNISNATPKTGQKGDMHDVVGIHLKLAAAIGSSVTLLLIGLILLAVFMCQRGRSQGSKTVDSSDDDSTDRMYRNPVYGANEPSLDNNIGANTPSASSSPSELHPGVHLNTSVFEEHRKQDTTEMPRTDFDAGDLTYCSIDDLPGGEKPAPLLGTDLRNIYEDCTEEDILDHKSLANISGGHVVTTPGAVSCVRDEAGSEMRRVTNDGYEECIAASSKNVPTSPACHVVTTLGAVSRVRDEAVPDKHHVDVDGYEECIVPSNKNMPISSAVAETTGDICDGAESENSPTRTYFTLERQSKGDGGNGQLNDFEIYHEVSLNGSAREDSPLDHRLSSDIKHDTQSLGINQQASSKLSASIASLCHEKEYNSLDFMKSGPNLRCISKSKTNLSRPVSTDSVDETKEANTYDVLNVQKLSCPSSPPTCTIHDNNVYNTLSGLHPDP